jgi:DNA-binding phage protein
MVKTKISARRRKYLPSTSQQKERHSVKLKRNTGIRLSNTTEELLNEELIGRAIWECLKNGDSEGVIEVISIYLEAVNKTQVAKESEMARSTMYHTLKNKNPTVKTLAKLIQACV